MGKDTAIEWADSTANPMMGCDGCELWTPESRDNGNPVRRCYAGRMIDGPGRSMAGQKGWPDAFAKPALFEHRIEQALRWTDLSGKARAGKPWLDGLPRLIFWCDLGDPFTKSLLPHPTLRRNGDWSDFWLTKHLPALSASPHQHLFLTKKPRQMMQFSQAIGGLPGNLWPGVSVTSEQYAGRLGYLAAVVGGGPRFVSIEPADSYVNISGDIRAGHLDWVIWGGGSGVGENDSELDWAERTLADTRDQGGAFFLKQITMGGRRIAYEKWPADLQVRQFPNFLGRGLF